MYTDIPQLPSDLVLYHENDSFILSWSPTQFTPTSYIISYFCKILCGSISLVTNQTVTVIDGETTTHIFSAPPSSSCNVSIMAVFGTTFISNKVSSSTNITSAAGIYTRLIT